MAERLAHRLDELGGLLPAAMHEAYGAGARSVLLAAARSAEQGLHIARGVLWATVLLVLFVAASDIPRWMIVLWAFALPLAGLVWLWIWRALHRLAPPGWLPYFLVFLDAWIALRGPLLAQTPWYTALGVDHFLSPADLAAASGPILTLVGISGAFRLDPRVAVFSTMLAICSYLYIAIALDVPHNVAVLVGAVIAFAGLCGVLLTRVFRGTVLRAREEAILERYVPRALIEELDKSDDPLGAGREADITVLTVDLRDYTRRAERLTPRETVALLNGYFALVVTPLADEGAVLDKYIGDGVLAFFEGEAHERRGLRAARAILAAIERHNASHPAVEALRVGIALHAGRALVGTIGAEQKREYTAIADVVNLAARLEELNKTFHSRVVASARVIDASPPDLRVGFVGPTVTPIRGHETSIAVYHLPNGAQ
jgi:adenylate cyclase